MMLKAKFFVKFFSDKHLSQFFLDCQFFLSTDKIFEIRESYYLDLN